MDPKQVCHLMYTLIVKMYVCIQESSVLVAVGVLAKVAVMIQGQLK